MTRIADFVTSRTFPVPERLSGTSAPGSTEYRASKDRSPISIDDR